MSKQATLFPDWPAPSGGSTANSLNSAIIRFIEAHGWQAERINEIGRPITDRQIEALIKHCVCGHTWKQVGEYMNINTRSAIELGTRAKKEYYKQVRKEVENNG